MDPTGGITLEAWIYPEDLTTVAYQEIFRKESGAGRQLFSFQINGTIISFGTDTTGNGYDELDIAITPSNYINRWCHFVATYTSGYKAIYVDGQLLGSNTGVTGNLIQGNANYFIGSTSGGSEFFNGYYASFKMYSKGLSATEVQQNYQATKDKFQGQQIVTNGLLLNLEAANKDSYPGTGTTWTNVATNAYNGTLYNGTSFRPNQNGGTIILDGVDDYVASSVNSALGNVATVVMLCYGTPSATDRMYCSFGGYDVYYYGGTNSRSLVFNTGNGEGYGCTGISDATISGLTMYTFVFRTDVSYSNNQIWINTTQQSIGQQFGTEYTPNRIFNAGNFQIGSWAGGGYYPNIGVLDTLVYNRQLSSTEITQNYNAFKAKFGF